MRLNYYMNNYNVVPEPAMFEQIKRDCSEYLEVVKDSRFLFRGYKGEVTSKAIIPRTDRKPKDMAQIFHKLYDETFYKKFGWRARSEGVFVTSDHDSTDQYGTPYYFFPFDGFKFLWSKEVDDLYNYTDKQYITNFKYKENHTLEDFVDETVETYQDTDLKKALNMEHEIMFKCKAYYLSKKSYAKFIRR